MMAGVYDGLLTWGVKPEQLHYEFFGPEQELTRQPALPAAVAEAERPTPAREKGRACCGQCDNAKSEAAAGVAVL